MSDTNCPICRREAKHREYKTPVPGKNDIYRTDCQYCGEYNISGSLEMELGGDKYSHIQKRILARYVRTAWDANFSPVTITTFDMDELFQCHKLPNPIEQFELFIIHVGDTSEEFGQNAPEESDLLVTKLGLRDTSAVGVLVNEAISAEFLEKRRSGGWRLTLLGWDKYADLKRYGINSNKIFMAMQFGSQDLDKIVKEYIRPATAETGMELLVLSDDDEPGLIDNRIRLEIRNSRLLICELSHANRGAHWEAGYAEGLGKPVIYLCRKNVFEGESDKVEKPHFDTNHLLTIPWAEDTIETDMDRLKACIRIAIPESKQSD